MEPAPGQPVVIAQSTNEAPITLGGDPVQVPLPPVAAAAPTFRQRLAAAVAWLKANVWPVVVKVAAAAWSVAVFLGHVVAQAFIAAADEMNRNAQASVEPADIVSKLDVARAIKGAAQTATLHTAIFSVAGVVILALLHGLAFLTPVLVPIPIVGWLISFLISGTIHVVAKIRGSDPFAAAQGDAGTTAP